MGGKKKRGEGEGGRGVKRGGGEVLVRMCLDCGGSWRRFLEGHVSYSRKSQGKKGRETWDKIVSKPLEKGEEQSSGVDLVRFFNYFSFFFSFFLFFFFFIPFLSSLFSFLLLVQSKISPPLFPLQKIPPRRNPQTNDSNEPFQ